MDLCSDGLTLGDLWIILVQTTMPYIQSGVFDRVPEHQGLKKVCSRGYKRKCERRLGAMKVEDFGMSLKKLKKVKEEKRESQPRLIYPRGLGYREQWDSTCWSVLTEGLSTDARCSLFCYYRCPVKGCDGRSG